MQLHYYDIRKFRRGNANFGDDLNLWLWPRLIPDVFNKPDDGMLFVGIGTLLNESIPRARRTVVFGAGIGNGSRVPRVDDSWTIYCVRGVLSAKALGIPAKLAVTDPAALVRTLRTGGCKKNSEYSFMPHVATAHAYGTEWRTVCQKLGFGYIDPQWSVDRVLAAIEGTSRILVESLHGAIVADALRIPWIPVVTAGCVFKLKWHDWCSSLGIPYQPWRIFPLRRCLTWPPFRNQPARSAQRWSCAKQLERIARNKNATLSPTRQLNKRLKQLTHCLNRLRDDLATAQLA